MSIRQSDIYSAAFVYQPFAPLRLSSHVYLLPHQLAALYGDLEREHHCNSPMPHRIVGLLRAGYPISALIADETGLGKTIIAGLYLLSLALRDMAHSVLVVAPKAVTGQWQDELLYKFGLHFRVVERGSELQGISRDTRAGAPMMVIASLDLIKGSQGQHFVSSFGKGGIDVTIIDEAHHVITNRDTLRKKVAATLALNSKSFLLLSATPFRGFYEGEYDTIKGMLGERFVYLRRFKDQAIGFDGKPLFPKRVSYTVNIRPSPEWARAYMDLERLIEASPLQRLTKLVLLKRMSSDFYALYDTLKKMDPGRTDDPFSMDTDDVSGIEPDLSEGSESKLQTSAHQLQVAADIVQNLLKRGKTEKESQFIVLLQSLVIKGKVVVFTEYRSTLNRLRWILDGMGIRYVYVHGGMSTRDRNRAVSVFWNDGQVKVFLATDAAGEGINLQVAHYQINYDLPWSPLKLEQRFGRIHRYGQMETASVYNLAVEGTLDERIVSGMMKKLDNMAKLLGDWVYDYIGSAVTPEEVRMIVTSPGYGIEEGVLSKRLNELRGQAHAPSLDKDMIDRGLATVDRLLENIDRVGHSSAPAFLDILRYSSALKHDLDYRSRTPVIKDAVTKVGVCRNSGSISLLYFLEGRDGRMFDPASDKYVEPSVAERYLEDNLASMAEFYGISCDVTDVSKLD